MTLKVYKTHQLQNSLHQQIVHCTTAFFFSMHFYEKKNILQYQQYTEQNDFSLTNTTSTCLQALVNYPRDNRLGLM